MPAFDDSLRRTSETEPERYRRRVEYDDTDHSPRRIAGVWRRMAVLLDEGRPLKSARQIAKLVRETPGAVMVALRQGDAHGFVDPVTEAAIAKTTDWAYNEAPSEPQGLVLAGPTAPARGVRVEPVRPFGVDPGERPDQRHSKLWRVFLVSIYGPVVANLRPFGWEAPLAAKLRPCECDDEVSATEAGRLQALADPLGYVLDFVGTVVAAFERVQPLNAPRLGLLLSMGRRDQAVPVNGLRQDHRGETLAAHSGWPEAVRRASGNLVPVVEVAHPEYEDELLHAFDYVTGNGLVVQPQALVNWVTREPVDAGDPEWEYLEAEDGEVPSILLRGKLIDRRVGRNVGRVVIALPPNNRARVLAVPNELDAHGAATIEPTLGYDERRGIVRVITAWAADNNFTGSCRRKTWYGWSYFSTTAKNADALELAWRMGAAVRFWHLQFTEDGPVDPLVSRK
jgi:hypothetical protein